MSILYSYLITGEKPVVYYRFGESSGTVAADSSGNGNTGTISATGVTYSVTGVILNDTNKALTLNGTSGMVTCPTSVDPSTYNQLTVSCWVKLSTLILTSSPAVVANDATGTSNKGVRLNINSTATALVFRLGNGTSATLVTGTFTFATGTWYYLVGTWDGTTMTAYVNGTSVGSAAFAGPIAASTSAFTFGHTPTGTDFLTGTIDEGAIYNYSWFSDTLLQNYNLALAGDGAGNFYDVSPYSVVLATDFNQVVQALQSVAGGKETGKYCLSGNGYTASTLVSAYLTTLSHDTSPVSITVDTVDGAPPANFSALSTHILTSGGARVDTTYAAASTSGNCSGNYTMQY